MDRLWASITEWLKEVLINGITSNLAGMFDSTNQHIGEIAGNVGTTPQAWNGSVFSMIQNLSETVIVPIAGLILLSEKLYPHLREIDEAAQNRLETMIPKLMGAAGISEKLKAENPMQWVGLMNNCKAQAEETILSELVYS